MSSSNLLRPTAIESLNSRQRPKPPDWFVLISVLSCERTLGYHTHVSICLLYCVEPSFLLSFCFPLPPLDRRFRTFLPGTSSKASSSTPPHKGENLADIDPLARHLLEQLLAPTSNGGGVDNGVDGGGGEEALVQRLGPSSLAALLRLQVNRGRPKLPSGEIPSTLGNESVACASIFRVWRYSI